MPAKLSPVANILECLPDAAVVVDPAGLVLHCNAAFVSAVDRNWADIVGESLVHFLRTSCAVAGARDVVARLAEPTSGPQVGRAVLRARGRRGVRCEFRIGRVALADRPCYLVILRQQSGESRPRPRQTDGAHLDTLTGLANRATFTARVEQEVRDAIERGREVALLFVDLDRFKEVNDGYGHERGDAVLRAVARRFLRALRADDLLARWGGDEFACLLPLDSDGRAVSEVAHRLLAAVAIPIEVDEGALAVGASIGIARLPDDAQTASELLGAADQALYVAKGRGGMHWQCFAPEMATRSHSRSHLRDELSRAMHTDELQLHYQPIVDAESLRPIGTEALIRWLHPTRGLMGPAAFLTLLTSSPERALQLLQIQIDRAIGDLDRVAGLAPQLAINFDARLVGNCAARAILDPLHAAASAKGLALMVELTEAGFNEQPARLSRFVDDIRRDGIQLAIDDFGGGQASLLRLREITFDVLKVDRAFIRDIARSPRDRTISGLAAKVAGELSGRSVAEGLETTDQIAWARRLGYHALQGFRIAKPMPAADLGAWAKAWQRRGRRRLVGEIEVLALG